MKRTQGRTLPLKTIVIVCEGAKTEPTYFDDLKSEHRLHTLGVIRVVPGQGAPISVVRRGIEELKQCTDRRDEVWCVFDTEVLANNPSFWGAVALAANRRLKLAVSNPAFEYWYILHFECTDRPFGDASDALDRLKRHIPGYEKSASVYPALKDLTVEAIKHAGQVRRQAADPANPYPNPSTGVDKLVIAILELAAKSSSPVHR